MAQQDLQKQLKELQEQLSEKSKAYEELKAKGENLIKIATALSAEHHLNILLENIVDEARKFTNADAGTLYILEENHLRFEILQNETMNTRMGGSSGIEINFPPVPLKKENVSAYVALEGETVVIDDVYNAKGFDFSGPRKYDEATGYRSQSMLVIPLKNHENDIIGVLQLLNAQNRKTKEVIPFQKEDIGWVEALASQAAVAIENVQLMNATEELFQSILQVLATAIDQKSPYSGGHVQRVAMIASAIVEKINETTTGPYADVHFTEDEIEEVRVAALLHDIGKITTPEWVVDKANKLSAICDRVDFVRERFKRAICLKQIELMKWEAIEPGNNATREALMKEIEELKSDMEFVTQCNVPGEFISDDKLERLQIIGKKTFHDEEGPHPLLTENELMNLSIRRGSLNDAERKIINNHIVVSIDLLEKIPFTKKYARVTEYAGGHHEKLDGTGYPKGLSEKDLALQTRILAFADIYEALTASDRPYKKKLPPDLVYKIMKDMAEQRHIDPNLRDFFEEHNLFTLLDKPATS